MKGADEQEKPLWNVNEKNMEKGKKNMQRILPFITKIHMA